MPDFSIPYGTVHINFSIPAKVHVDTIQPKHPMGIPDPIEYIGHTLENLTGGFQISSYIPGTKVAIAINDKTRPVPHQHLLPPLLTKLHEAGYPLSSIIFIIASGTHIPMPDNEYPKILPQDILSNYTIISHNCDDEHNLLSLGVTSRGTPVKINQTFMEANLKIVVGDIEPHHFMGFSGGIKSAAIGLAGRETINQNHSLITLPGSSSGHYEDNQMRQDIEEIGDMIGVQIALNAVLNPKKEIVHALAGSPRSVMELGIPLVREVYLVEIPYLYDLVIASSGGYPKDINLYQAQKGLTHAAMMIPDGKTVILAAECIEGVGNEKYEHWMENIHSHAEVLRKTQTTAFEVGPHKAYLISRDASRKKIVVYSSMSTAKIQSLLIEPAKDFQESINTALKAIPLGGKIAILPQAALTIPFRKE